MKMLRSSLVRVWLVCLLAWPLTAHAAGIPIDEGRGIPTLAPVVKKVTAGVVSITATGGAPLAETNRFLGPNQAQRQTTSTGSGVIVDAANGYILTNQHVVANQTRFVVRLNDGRQFDAKLVGSDSPTDIAVLQIKAPALTAVPFGDSKSIEVGDFVVAIGNPFGIGQTVTLGIVGAVGRGGLNIEGYEDFIQTDAAINPGNSGGAVVDMRGEVVGISTAILAPGGAGGNVGIGFAVPIAVARAVMAQIVEFGDVRRGQIGITYTDLTPQVAKAMGLSVTAGVVVMRVEPGTGAARGGLSAGDVIVGLNGTEVRDMRDLRNQAGLIRAGETVTFSVLHDQKPADVRVTLTAALPTVAATGVVPALAGSVFADIDPTRPVRGATTGVSVRSVEGNSNAFRNGLREGDLILAINNRPVETVAELERLARQADSTLAITVSRDGQTQLVLAR